MANQLAVAAAALHVLFVRRSELAEFGPDIVIGTVPALPTAVVTAVAAKVYRIPYVIDLRDAWPDLLRVSKKWDTATGSPSLTQRVLGGWPLRVVAGVTELVLNYVFRRADAIISTSDYLAAELRSRVGEQCLVTTVRNVFPPETNLTNLERSSPSTGGLNVLYAGTLGRAQNLANAVKAARLAEIAGVKVALRFVGAGAAKDELMKEAEQLKLEICFESRRGAEQLKECYEWADTALVHLTDWEPLNSAVPSKTYELMSAGVHISGVVTGETADLIRQLKAGHVVEPEKPEDLARLWVALARNREQLRISKDGARWVDRERRAVAPSKFLECLEWVISQDR